MPKRILLVDDSPSIRSLVRVFLVSGGYDFVEADSGERALGVLKIIPADLVIVDVNMPGMGGLELVRKMRAHPRPHVRSAAVILLTGDRSEELRQEGLQAGANDFLFKPVSSEQLNQLVGSIFASPAP